MKTTLRNIIKEINFTEKMESQVNWEDLSALFDIYNLGWSDEVRLKSYFIKTWKCTDTWVGTRAYFLDNEFIGISEQPYRKSNEVFYFTSKENIDKVRLYILSLVDENNGIDHISILSNEMLDEEMDDTFKIQYESQILHKTALLNNERVVLVALKYPIIYNSDSYSREVILPSGERIKVDCRKLDFEYNTLE